MPIRFRCESCQQISSISTRMAGLQVGCPTCGVEIIVPDTDGLARLARQEEAAVEFAEAPAEDDENRGAGSEQDFTPADVTTADAERPVKVRAEITVRGGIELEQQTTIATIDGDEEEDEGEFSLWRSEADFGDLDMTPMIDVTFLLLIFFMITASFSLQKTLQIPKPSLDEKGAQQQQTLDDFEANSVIVQIDGRNDIKIDYEPLHDVSDLVDTLYDKKRSEQKNEILIEAHADSWQETVVIVIDAANEVGMEKIRLAELSSE